MKLGAGAWHHETNAEKFRAFWAEGIDRMRSRESIDWTRAPFGTTQVPTHLTGPGSQVTVLAEVHHPETPKPDHVSGFVESQGVVSMEAEHFARAVSTESIPWQVTGASSDRCPQHGTGVRPRDRNHR